MKAEARKIKAQVPVFHAQGALPQIWRWQSDRLRRRGKRTELTPEKAAGRCPCLPRQTDETGKFGKRNR